MGVGSGLYMYDVVVKRSRSLSHLLMSSCLFCNKVCPNERWNAVDGQPEDILLSLTLSGGVSTKIKINGDVE